MLFCAIPHHDSIQLATPPTFYPISYVVPSPIVTARERYLRSVAEVARRRYLRELEEQRLLESLRRQEELRAELRHQEAVSQALLRHRQGQSLHAPRRATSSVDDNYGRSPIFRASFYPENARVPSGIEQRTDPIQAVEDLLDALIGRDDQEATDEDSERHGRQAHANQARRSAVQEARARFLSELDAIKEKAQAVRNSRDQESKSRPITSNYPQDDKPAQPTCAARLARKAEIPRNRDRRDRAARTIQSQWRSHSANVASLKDALTTIDVLRARFKFLRETFTFPEHLEFKKEEADGSETPQLSYSPLNAGVHAYMHELTKLLTNADAVPSGGDQRVRNARRAFVQAVEAQLQALEERVRKVWGKRRASASPSEGQNEDSTVRPVEVNPTAERVSEQDPVALGEVAEPTEESTVDLVETPVDTPGDVDNIPVESSAHDSGAAPSPTLHPIASDDLAPSPNVSPSSPEFIFREDLPQTPASETITRPDESDTAPRDEIPPANLEGQDRNSTSVVDGETTAAAIESQDSSTYEHIAEVIQVSSSTEEAARPDVFDLTRAPSSPSLPVPPPSIDSGHNDEDAARPTSPDFAPEPYNIVYPDSDSRSETPIRLDDGGEVVVEVVDLNDDYRQDAKDVEGNPTAQEDEEFEVL